MIEQQKEVLPLMVSIRCNTYNHERYIRQCLEGFVIQKTNFRFEAIVHDDASTDGTAAIIREYAEKYPDIIKPIYETENQYSKHDGSLRKIINKHMHGKYIAVCEGDDYWIDPFKLQKQVDFLENNPEYGLVHTAAKSYHENKKIFDRNNIGKGFSNVEDLLVVNHIAALTVCYRKHLYFDYLSEITPQSSWKMGDYPLWLYIGFHSKIHFMNDVTSVYRILSESASHSRDLMKNVRFSLSAYSISEYFVIKYEKQHLIDDIKRQTLYSIICAHIISDKRVDFSICKVDSFVSLIFQ